MWRPVKLTLNRSVSHVALNYSNFINNFSYIAGNVETVKIIDPIKDPRWDHFVNEHPFGWICQLSGWKKLLEANFHHIKGYYFALLDENSSTIKAALPVFHIKSWLTGTRLVSTPFATLFDPLISSKDQLSVLLNSVLNLLRELGCSYFELRSILSTALVDHQILTKKTFYRHHFLRLHDNPEVIKENFHRSCVRQKISKAIKSNVTYKIADNESDLKEFYKLYLLSRKRLGLPSMPYSFFKDMWDIFFPAKQMLLMLAMVNRKCAAGLILLRFKKRTSAEFSVNDQLYLKYCPNHLLFWEAIKMAHSDGYDIFDFGRTSIQNEGLLNFKRRWGTIQTDLPVFIYPTDIALKYDGMENSLKYKLMNKICKKAPAYSQKLIGNICYRHIG